MACAGAGSQNIYDIEHVKKYIPESQITLEKREMTINDIISELHVRDIDYKDAKFNAKYILDRQEKCSLLIPERQRFYVWDFKRQNDLIDSIIKNFPIPSVIITNGESRGTFYQEDGQQRFITLWRFAHNLFPYKPTNEIDIKIYYDKVPDNSLNCYSMKNDFPELKHRIDSYRIPVIAAKQIYDDSVLPIIFERLNSGKNLMDCDKLWNRKESNLVKSSLEIASDPSIYTLLKKHLGIDVKNIYKKNRSLICNLVGIVLALSIPFNESDIWGDVLTKSFLQHCKYLNNDINKEEIIHNIKILLTIYDNSIEGDKKLNNNTVSTNRAFTRHFGTMIYDLRYTKHTYNTISEPIIKLFISKWIKIVDLIRNDPYKIDDANHIIQKMYINGDNKSKNQNIGKYIKQRHQIITSIDFNK